ncbi:MAG: DUF2490 domain-containing protein, partial [Cyclobacteriaceae bacterium]|nr:DUF2490 domain-containing protein [Cyclobacteriaceae bacterium SS2]
MRVTGFAIWVYFFLIVSALSYGQKQVNTGNQQWFQYYNTLQIANHWAIQTDMGIRYREQMSDLSQMVFRSGLEYQWNSNIRTTAGFAFLTFHQDGVRSRVEYRPYQELDITDTYGSIKTQHRFRL